jgi:Metallo-beta-lactamase superfamily
MIVDSCIDKPSATPAAIKHLSELGIRPEESVDLIIMTHWHDDHIRGAATLLESCQQAKFCCSSALGAKEFIAMVSAYNSGFFSRSSSGVREIHEIYRILRSSNRTSLKAAPDRPIYFLPASVSGHAHDCRVTTLSPSDLQIDLAWGEIAALMPQVDVDRTKRRCSPRGPNHLSVVVWIDIGPVAVLLGGDLEETETPGTGWSAIVASATRPAGEASVFKIPHHGSANAHSSEVWEQMLRAAPFALVTPYKRREKLPRKSDVEQITALTKDAYSTAKLASSKIKKLHKSVEKTLRESGVVMTEAEPEVGLVRLRNGGMPAFDLWSVDLLQGACPLRDVHG